MRLTGAHITPTCRKNRTTDGAWDEAVDRMREVYDAQLARFPDCTITLWVAIDEPEARADDT